jgi:hypothetical protein
MCKEQRRIRGDNNAMATVVVVVVDDDVFLSPMARYDGILSKLGGITCAIALAVVH